MFILPFSEITLKDLPETGGKNSSLGEMYNRLGEKNISVPNGFAITAAAFRQFLKHNEIDGKIKRELNSLDTLNYSNLRQIGDSCKKMILQGTLMKELVSEIIIHYRNLSAEKDMAVAVRSSATAEDLPNASFAGQHESFLNVRGEKELLEAVIKCYASLYNERAIKYRVLNGFEHMRVALSVGIQKMVRSDEGCAGVVFTIDPESGFQDMVYITGIWGLGENLVQGNVSPDEYYVFKPTLKLGKNAIVTKKIGAKEMTMTFGNSGKGSGTLNMETPRLKKECFVLNNIEIEKLARWSSVIEEHYKMPMDIEWAKDGINGEIYIVQARPETIHRSKKEMTIREYHLVEKGKVLVSGKAVGGKIVSGKARILSSPAEGHLLQEGEILVTDTTNPDWNTAMKKASVIVTNKGGRTSHASIVARELGLSAVVGCLNATEVIRNGQVITVSCGEGDRGNVYEGSMKWEEKIIQPGNILMPETAPMLILADPGRALNLSQYPNKGVGLLRMEFIINNHVRVHPMALVKFNELNDKNATEPIQQITAKYPNKKDYFIEELSQGVAMIAAAFYPKDVIVRMSDFKTNEYANLLGGREFEPQEENPMIGFRGASRYYNERYKDGFRLECAAIKKVRSEMGLHNVKLMIPFCRTVEEGKKVIALMEEEGLKRGEEGLEIYVMAEIPSNVIQAEEFAQIFDGFSIGSNDLTQLTLGIDRDSHVISELFDENNPSAKWMIKSVVEKAKKAGVKIGLCGQAPSDYPKFAKFLVSLGIDSISFNPDALIKGIENTVNAEKEIILK